jgi:CheY-like chemotaxis protein
VCPLEETLCRMFPHTGTDSALIRSILGHPKLKNKMVQYLIIESMDNSHSLLLVDDDVDWLQIMEKILTKAGFPVYISVNAEDITQKIARFHPALILLDIHMKGVSGQEVCQRLKADHDTAGIPLVLLSSNADIERVATSCGADGFISKTVSMKELKDRLMPFFAGAA